MSWAKRFWPVLLVIVGTALQSGILRAAPPGYDTERADMVARLRRNGITDQHVLDAMLRVPRHIFCSPGDRKRSYEEQTIPVDGGQTLSPPLVVARAAQKLELKPGMQVLEVGAGCGYCTAVLSELTNKVHAVDHSSSVLGRAMTRLKNLGYTGIETHSGKACSGWSQHGPFDAILVTCAAEAVPDSLVSQLKEGGRMVIPIGTGPEQTLNVLTKNGSRLRSESIMQVRVEPMVCKSQSESP